MAWIRRRLRRPQLTEIADQVETITETARHSRAEMERQARESQQAQAELRQRAHFVEAEFLRPARRGGSPR